MTDKEIGELWRWLRATEYNTPLEDKTILLIRKLVEERAYANKWERQNHRYKTDPEWPIKDWQREAREQFGISEEDWK